MKCREWKPGLWESAFFTLQGFLREANKCFRLPLPVSTLLKNISASTTDLRFSGSTEPSLKSREWPPFLSKTPSAPRGRTAHWAVISNWLRVVGRNPSQNVLGRRQEKRTDTGGMESNKIYLHRSSRKPLGEGGDDDGDAFLHHQVSSEILASNRKISLMGRAQR